MRVQKERFQEIPADFVHWYEQRVNPNAVPCEPTRGDGALLDFHGKLSLLVLVAHAAEKRNSPGDLSVKPVERAHAEGDGQGSARSGVRDDDVGHGPPGAARQAADQGACLFAAEAVAEHGTVVEEVSVQAASSHDHFGCESRELFSRLVPVHNSASEINDVQAILDLVEKIGEGDL